jgi:hypothetical protein
VYDVCRPKPLTPPEATGCCAPYRSGYPSTWITDAGAASSPRDESRSANAPVITPVITAIPATVDSAFLSRFGLVGFESGEEGLGRDAPAGDELAAGVINGGAEGSSPEVLPDQNCGGAAGFDGLGEVDDVLLLFRRQLPRVRQLRFRL